MLGSFQNVRQALLLLSRRQYAVVELYAWTPGNPYSFTAQLNTAIGASAPSPLFTTTANGVTSGPPNRLVHILFSGLSLSAGSYWLILSSTDTGTLPGAVWPVGNQPVPNSDNLTYACLSGAPACNVSEPAKSTFTPSSFFDGPNLRVTGDAVPEPSTLALCLTAAGLLIAQRRARR